MKSFLLKALVIHTLLETFSVAEHKSVDYNQLVKGTNMYQLVCCLHRRVTYGNLFFFSLEKFLSGRVGVGVVWGLSSTKPDEAPPQMWALQVFQQGAASMWVSLFPAAVMEVSSISSIQFHWDKSWTCVVCQRLCCESIFYLRQQRLFLTMKK